MSPLPTERSVALTFIVPAPAAGPPEGAAPVLRSSIFGAARDTVTAPPSPGAAAPMRPASTVRV